MSFPTNGWSVVRIVSKQAWLHRDRRLLTATNLVYVKMKTSGIIAPCRHVKKSHALCLLLATERARVGECPMLRWRRRNLGRRPTPDMIDTFDILLVDLQDVGYRIYTFVTRLRYVPSQLARDIGTRQQNLSRRLLAAASGSELF
jgi:hypothetical protein